MEREMIPLKEIVYDARSRNGLWCCLPYPGHPKGCPQFPKCPALQVDFLEVKDCYDWVAVIEDFNLKSYADERKKLHPEYSERQARNLLYWQGGVRSRLKKKAYSIPGALVLEIPEASGINVFETMDLVGLHLMRNPDIVHKIMFVGVPLRRGL